MKTKLRSMCRIIENCWHISNRIWTIKGFAEIQRVADHRVLKGKIFARKMAILQKLIQRKAFETILFHSKIVRVIKKNKVQNDLLVHYVNKMYRNQAHKPLKIENWPARSRHYANSSKRKVMKPLKWINMSRKRKHKGLAS